MASDWMTGGTAALTSGLNFLGGMLAMDQQSATNATNIGVAREQAQFNAAQAANAQNTSMDFNARQAEIQRDFQSQANQQNFAFGREMATFSAEQAQKNRDFQELMSNTSYQRQMADMKKAGLNPILAAGSMAGASSPSGSAASGMGASAAGSGSASSGAHSGSGTPGRAESPGNAMQRGIGNAVQSAMDAYRLHADVDLREAQSGMTHQQSKWYGQGTEKIIQDTYNVKEQNRLLRQEQDIKDEHIKQEKFRTHMTAKQLSDMSRYGSQYTPGTWERINRTIQNRLEEIPPPFAPRE